MRLGVRITSLLGQKCDSALSINTLKYELRCGVCRNCTPTNSSLVRGLRVDGVTRDAIDNRVRVETVVDHY